MGCQKSALLGITQMTQTFLWCAEGRYRYLYIENLGRHGPKSVIKNHSLLAGQTWKTISDNSIEIRCSKYYEKDVKTFRA